MYNVSNDVNYRKLLENNEKCMERTMLWISLGDRSTWIIEQTKIRNNYNSN